MSNKEVIISKIKNWIEFDDQIKELQNKLKDYKIKKKFN